MGEKTKTRVIRVPEELIPEIEKLKKKHKIKKLKEKIAKLEEEGSNERKNNC